MSEWQPVPGYGSRYKINRAGEIRSIEGAVLNPWHNADGYPPPEPQGEKK